MKNVIINRKESFENRTRFNITVTGQHNDYVESLNKINDFAKKYNAQQALYQNKSSLLFDKNGNAIGLTYGHASGNIIFHSHSCDHLKVADEFVKLIDEE
jgi:hypothetical protein